MRLKNDIEEAWTEGKKYFEQQVYITGSELYDYVTELAKKYGWVYGQEHCGQLIGNFPHELIQGEEVINYILPDNNERMRNLDKKEVSRLDFGNSFC